MSHFTVLVVGEDHEAALAPFNEQDEEYMQFVDNTDEWRADYERDTQTMWMHPEGEKVSKFDSRFTQKKAEGFGTEQVKPDMWSEVEVPMSEVYGSFEKYCLDYHGAVQEGERFGYMSNPDAKWDWYQVGGRWAGFLTLKEGAKGEQGVQSWMQRHEGTPYPEGKVDRAYKGDIDFDAMRNDAGLQAQQEYAQYEAIVKEHGPLPSDEWRKLSHDDPAFKEAKDAYWENQTVKALQEAKLTGFMGLPNDIFAPTLEEQIERARLEAVCTYAYLKDGEWVEPGAMGWWGISSETKESKLDFLRRMNAELDAMPDDTMITVVDCHI